MASAFIGIIVGANTGEVKAVINPNHDSELDNPRFLLLQGGEHEPMRMIKTPRGEYMGALTMDDVAKLVTKHQGR